MLDYRRNRLGLAEKKPVHRIWLISLFWKSLFQMMLTVLLLFSLAIWVLCRKYLVYYNRLAKRSVSWICSRERSLDQLDVSLEEDSEEENPSIEMVPT